MIKPRPLLFCMLFMGLRLYAQDVKPSNTSTGQLNFKSSTNIDFATGILNYRIPLMDIPSEAFNLPIGLTYRGGGIKNGEKSGTAGLGWALNTGAGIITRTTRGLSADEEPLKGFLNNPVPTGNVGDPAFDQYLEKVNSGRIDGESDIFSMNIQGTKIDFILIKSGTTFQVKQLQKTDLIIVPTIITDKIQNWTVTDGNGNVYEFAASSEGNITMPGNMPYVASSNRTVTSWYISKIKPFNSAQIEFNYLNEQYVDLSGIRATTAVSYSPALKIPDLENPGLRAQLTALSSLDSETAAAIQKISANIQIIQDAAMRAGELQRSSPFIYNMENYANPEEELTYRNQINLWRKNLDYVQMNNLNAKNQVAAILGQMYSLAGEKKTDYSNSSKESLFVDKLLSSIVLPSGIVKFSYRELNPYGTGQTTPKRIFVCTKVTFTNRFGQDIEAVLLNIDKYGYLKDVKWVDPKGTVNNWMSMRYYSDDLPNQYFDERATDYWGYYNGKQGNGNLFPSDPSYMTLNSNSPIGFTNVFFGGGAVNGISNSDRRPDPTFAIARSLSSISTQDGQKIDFTYEGNEIYSADADMNIPMGGLRISKVTVNDGNNNYTTSYRYAFPKSTNPSILRSTGRLNEWQKKIFSWPYQFSGGTDYYLHSDPVYWGSLYNDNSNNGVLYHYVEEVFPDSSAIGYKFSEIDPGHFVLTDQYQDHNSFIDKILLAKISYNANGKIVEIERQKFKYPTSLLKKRLSEFNQLKTAYPFFEDAGSLQPVLWRQIKKEPVHFNHADMLQAYPNSTDPRYTMNYGDRVFTINPYYAYYVNNFPQRESHSQQARIYDMMLESAILLSEQQTLIFSDYDLSAFNSAANPTSLPKERPYDFDRLIRYTAAKRISKSVNYAYEININPLYPTQIKTVDSRNTINLKKMKYVWSYNLPSEHVLTQLKQMNRVSDVVEKQEWKSLDNGTSYRLASGAISEYGVQTVNGKKYIYPVKKYGINLDRMLPLPNSSYSESAFSVSPFTTQFWDNKNLYSLEETYTWGVYNGHFRIGQVNDRTGNLNSTAVYDNDGRKILVSNNIKKDDLIAADFSPIVAHDYYAQKFGRFGNSPWGIRIDPTITFAYLSTLNVGSLMGYPATSDRLDYKNLFTDVRTALANFKNSYPSDPLLSKPLFQDFVDISDCFAKSKSVTDFSPVLARCWYDYAQSAYVQGDYYMLMSQMQAKGLNGHAVWFCIDKLYNYLRDSNRFLLEVKKYDNIQRAFTDLNWGTQEDKVYQMGISGETLSKRFVNFYYVVNRKAVLAGSTLNLRVKAVYANGTSSTISTVNIGLDKRFDKRPIDLNSFSNYQNIVALQFILSNYDLGERLSYFAAVPIGGQFSASSYLPDDRLYLEMDDNLNLSEHFYDRAGNPHFTKNHKDEITGISEKHLPLATAQTPRLVKINIENQFPGQTNITPGILLMNLQSTGSIPEAVIPVNLYPQQKDSYDVPARNYSINLKTTPGNYTLKINGVIVPHASDGISAYNIDMSNLETVLITVAP